MIAFSRSSYNAILVSDCMTRSRDVTRWLRNAACMLAIEASTTLKRGACCADSNATDPIASTSARCRTGEGTTGLLLLGRFGGAQRSARLLEQIRLDEQIE